MRIPEKSDQLQLKARIMQQTDACRAFAHQKCLAWCERRVRSCWWWERKCSVRLKKVNLT
jgi:hypothetical protein